MNESSRLNDLFCRASIRKIWFHAFNNFVWLLHVRSDAVNRDDDDLVLFNTFIYKKFYFWIRSEFL